MFTLVNIEYNMYLNYIIIIIESINNFFTLILRWPPIHSPSIYSCTWTYSIRRRLEGMIKSSSPSNILTTFIKGQSIGYHIGYSFSIRNVSWARCDRGKKPWNSKVDKVSIKETSQLIFWFYLTSVIVKVTKIEMWSIVRQYTWPTIPKFQY